MRGLKRNYFYYIKGDIFNQFLSDVRKATLQKQDSGCFTDDTANDCIANLVVKLGSSHKAYYHPKVEKAFQLYLMKNQANNEYKYTKEDICSICNVGHAAFERFAPSSAGERDFISADFLKKLDWTVLSNLK